jgi:hypothetical protein
VSVLSKQSDEFVHGQSRLANDAAQSSRFQIARGMKGHGYGSRRITWKYQDVMAASDAVNDESGSI